MENSDFEVGNIVTRPSGKKPFRLTYVPVKPSRWDPYKGIYINTNTAAQSERVVHYAGDSKDKSLYSFTDDNGEKVVGLHIGTNSKGLYILEVDDGRDDYVFEDPKDIEEVIPYTFSIDVAGREVHYRGESGKVFEGDLLLQMKGKGNYEIVKVRRIDTKCKEALSGFKGVRILTEAIF